ncbi:MAG: FAD/NAD(P)-binding protein [Bacillota bacterium]
MLKHPLFPQVAVVERISRETADIKTFSVAALKGGVPFNFMPGQCAMLSVPAVGEALFSITSAPAQADFLEFSIKKTGAVTDCLHGIEEGCQIAIRGPYGNGFPVAQLKGRDLLFIGGGIGLAPLRSLINYCLVHRGDYGNIHIVYGARSAADLMQRKELYENWPASPATSVYLTVDTGQEGWDGHVGFVPQYVEELGFSPQNSIALTCGPPIMIKYVLAGLERLGFQPEQIHTTLEMRMKCGVGKCGRCNIGGKYVCRNGPVFNFAELKKLPAEY